MNLKVCRICLVTDIKMYKSDRFQLESYYEQIMTTKGINSEDLPQYFCYECAAMLYKFHKFKEKCRIGQKVYQNLLSKGNITIKKIRNIDRTANKLKSTLDILSANITVKTFIFKRQVAHKPRLKPIELKILPSETDNFEEKENNDKQDEEISNLDKEHKIEIPDVIKVINKPIVEIERMTIEEKNLKLDDDNIFAEDIRYSSSEDELVIADFVTEKRKRRRKSEEDVEESKAKRFEVSDKKSGLDPKNWVKVNLTEEEALQEFKARGEQKRYLSAEYKCESCLRGFSKADMLNRHIKLRHNESIGPIECRFCSMRFKWKCYLNKHMKQHYTKFKCLRCDLVCPLETSALFHEEYHNGVIRKCDHCGEEFKHLTTYYTHLRTHRSEHVCAICGASFVSAMGLKIHKKIKHLNTSETPREEEEQYCERCDVKFETKNAYQEHLIHSAKHVDGIEESDRKTKNKRNTRIPTDCHICGKHFNTQAACRKHHLAEHPRTSFFAPNERQICEICGVSLAPGSVTSHLNTHTREKSYTCNICGRQFSSKGGVTMHQLTHTSEKPVQCTLCDKRFKQSSSMKLHYRTFHLKEPYPKRNRKKNGDDSKFDYGHEESDDTMTLDRWR